MTKVVILAGGFGTRLSEETKKIPKPMVEIGGMPMIWHIMKIFSHQGFNDFIICLGYKGNIIKEFFRDLYMNSSDVTFDLRDNKITFENIKAEPWNVSLVETGLYTMTGGRIKRLKEKLGNEAFFVAYGDCVSDVDLNELLKFHKKKKMKATLTSVIPDGRFGVLDINDGIVNSFREKQSSDVGWINGGFMVLEPSVLSYIKNDDVMLEVGPLGKLAEEGELAAYQHKGFWKCMDTLKDRNDMEDLWQKDPKWKIWKE
ncbi:MAG: glucose-1-phosphate cytidylyltransferase [Methanomassiliicoccaceae archaeon]|nr:glucose-1-phosphate cytidylyltransferase [Methanomassiliicoccaceae archaeon]